MTDSGSVPRRLLIIDDDPACRTTIGWLLRKLGHTVAEAESGSAGLALLRQTPVVRRVCPSWPEPERSPFHKAYRM